MRFFIILSLLLSLSSAEPREALLIGNYDYKYISVLDNPEPNIKRLKKVLENLNFNVKMEKNLNSEYLEDSIDKFAKRLRRNRNTTGFLYYSGHGCQLDNRGYLLPTNVDSKKRLKVKYNALSINQMLETLEQSGNRLNMLFLDACRDVPMGTKGGTKGLAQPMTRPKGSLIVYATESGKTADDNSNFINALIDNIQNPNEHISSVARNISNTVADITNDEQVPVFFEKRLPYKFMLNEVSAETVIPPSTPVLTNESKELQACKLFSYEDSDTDGIIHERTLKLVKKLPLS